VKTIVHLMRHGEVHNPEKVLYGRLAGYQLSELGQRMAKAAATTLASHDITYVIASPLERAQQTARPIAEQFGLPVHTDADLIESANRFEGRNVESAMRDPRTWRWFWNPFQPSWGEPYKTVRARMLLALEAARRAAEGHEAVAVSHQLPIWTLRRALEKRSLWHDPRSRQCALASLTSFHFDGSTLTKITYTPSSVHA
jgi:broad specificity phosphatase PhoE